MENILKLHIGNGWRNWPGWVNVDAGDYPNIHLKDVTKLPYDDNSVDLIYSSHLIAYFDRQEIFPILSEWHRALKPGSILRLATPDFGAIATLYQNKGCTLDNFLGPLYGRMPLGKNTVYHKTAYDYMSLKQLLLNVGFSKIREYNWKETDHAQFDDHSRAHFPNDDIAISTGDFTEDQTLISLNVEAIK